MNNLNFEALSIYDGLPKTKTIQWDMTIRSKEKLKLKASSYNISMSQFVRAAVHSNDIIVQLDPDGNIARNLIETNDILTSSLRNKFISTDICNKVVYKCNEVFIKLNEVSEQLPRISADFTSADEVITTVNSEQLKTDHFQFKDCEKLNEFIETKAAMLDLNKSQLLRISTLADDTVYLLKHSGYIARYIIEIQNNLSIALHEEKLEDKYEKIIRSKIEDIFNKFIEVTIMLTNINKIEDSSNEGGE